VIPNQNLGQRWHEPEIDRRWSYVAIIGLEILVIAALWAFGRYFGSL
jgi:hypothetical protein